MEKLNSEQLAYWQAHKEMKQIKGFYIHLSVYLFINAVILLQFLLKVAPESDARPALNFYTGILWGVALLIHAVSALSPTIRKWERRKTTEFLSENQTKNPS